MPDADDMDDTDTFESEQWDDAVPDELTGKALYFQSLDSVSFCFPCSLTLIATVYLPLFDSPTLTSLPDPWRRANDNIRMRCVNRAFNNVTEHFARLALENRRTEIFNMATTRNVRKALMERGYVADTKRFPMHVRRYREVILNWQQQHLGA